MNPCRRRAGVMKALRVLKAWTSIGIYDYLDAFRKGERHARSMVNTRKKCSCFACGNPRRVKWFPHKDRVTKQELLSEISFKEQLKESEENDDQE